MASSRILPAVNKLSRRVRRTAFFNSLFTNGFHQPSMYFRAASSALAAANRRAFSVDAGVREVESSTIKERLNRARSLADVFSVYEEDTSSFQPEDYSAAIEQVAKKLRYSRDGHRERLIRAPAFFSLLDSIENVLPDMSRRDIVRVTWALASLSSSVRLRGSLLARLESAVEAQLREGAVAAREEETSGWLSVELDPLAAMKRSLLQQLDQYNLQGSIEGSLVGSDRREVQFKDAVVHAKRPSMRPYVRTAAPLASYAIGQDLIHRTFLAYVDSNQYQGLSRFSLSRQPHISVALDNLQDPFTHIAEANSATAYSGDDLATIAWAFGCFNRYEPQLFSALGALCSSPACKMSPGNLANVLWSHAKLGVYDASLLEVLSRACTKRIETFDASALTNAVWAFSLLTYSDKAFLTAVSEACVARAKQFDATQIVYILYSFAMIGHYEPKVWTKLWGLLCRVPLVEWKEKQLPLLHTIDWALRTEGSSLKLTLPDHIRDRFYSNQAVLQQLMFSDSDMNWRSAFASKERKVSDLTSEQPADLKTQVCSAFKAMNVTYTSNIQDVLHDVDIVLGKDGSCKVGVEVETRYDYAANEEQRVLGPALLRRRLLSHSGWKIARVAAFEWDDLSTEDEKRFSFLRQKLKDVGVSC